MSATGEPNIKKQKLYNNQHYKHRKKQFLEAGQRGFLATCNFREKDCVRECYNILNQYANKLYGEISITDGSANDEEEVDDISDALQKAINASKQNNKTTRPRFQAVDTGTTNCIFIRTTLTNPIELGLSIVKDIVTTNEQKTRHLLRLLPIDIVCHANVSDILKAAGELFDKYFLKTPTTFSIAFNRRYNNSIHRDDIIPDLAALVRVKNVENKVDLKHSKKTIIIEIIKGLCCLSVVEDYLMYKKYNLVELANFKSPLINETQKHDEVKVDKVVIKEIENTIESVSFE